ncbi:MAG: rod shape-determining protein RodA [Opitutales bacterium]|nr:rod shape-determining protein RodA [Opitutales bacterium]
MNRWAQWVYYRLQSLQQDRLDCDWVNPIIMLILSAIGLALIYSVQLDVEAHAKWHQQLLWILVGLCVYGVTARIHYKFFFQNAHWLYLLSILALCALWTPLGKSIGGSRRWIHCGAFAVQPSNFGTLAALLMCVNHLARMQFVSLKDHMEGILYTAVIGGIPCLLIFIQPDFGSAILIPMVLIGLWFVANIKLRFFVGMMVVSVLGLGIVALDSYAYSAQLQQKTLKIKPFLPLKDYQRNRILSFAAPSVVDPRGVTVGWQLKQSLIAISSGGTSGKGWLKNMQSRLGFLPKATSLDDFIFSVLAEETGLWGTYFVFALYGILILNTLRIALIARDLFGYYLCVGIALLMSMHVWINVGMTLGIMPITGISIPFLSYGGSFMLMCFFSQGLVQSVYRFRLSE